MGTYERTFLNPELAPDVEAVEQDAGADPEACILLPISSILAEN